MRGATYTSDQQRRVSRVIPDLVRNRELLADLITKDLRARYRYATAGFLWAVLEPLALTLILYVVFGVVMQFHGGAASAPLYAVWLLCGLVFWQFMARSLAIGVRSLVDNQSLVSKVYFPREIIPLSTLGVNVVHFFIGTAILLALFLAVGGRPGIHALWLLPIFAVEFILAAGLVLFLASTNVFYRDATPLTDVALVLGFYATPIFYDYTTNVLPLASGHAGLVRLYALNPLVGLITASRQALLENRPPNPSLLAWPVLLAALLLIVGVVYFRRRAGILADYL